MPRLAMPRLVMPALALFGLLLTLPALAQTNDPHRPAALADGRVRITSAADLPIHTYTVTSKAVPLAEDNEAMSSLAAAVSAAITSDLAQYDIADRSTRRDLYRTLEHAALLQQDFDAARRYSGIVRGLQDKPADQATSGLIGTALIDALQSPGADFHQTLRAGIVRAYRPIPYAWSHEDLQEQKSVTEIMTRDRIITHYANTVAPDSAGRLSQSQADDLLTEAFGLRYVLPNKADLIAAYSDILASERPGPKADLWAARDVTLAPAAKLTPVVVGVWDSGVDIRVYKSQLVSGQPGIAFDAQARPTTGLLYSMPGGVESAAAYQVDNKGASDFLAGRDSPEAAAFKTKLTGMTSDQANSFEEGLSQIESYQHGTYVAGIALRGNPAARLLVCRMTQGEWPSVAQVERDAAMFRQSVAYFKTRGARAVNMSWITRLAVIETDLEHDGTVRTPAERRALAKKSLTSAAGAFPMPFIVRPASCSSRRQATMTKTSCSMATTPPMSKPRTCWWWARRTGAAKRLRSPPSAMWTFTPTAWTFQASSPAGRPRSSAGPAPPRRR